MIGPSEKNETCRGKNRVCPTTPGARQPYFAGVTILWCPYLLNGKTSYCQISLSLEVARNFTGNDAAEVPVKFQSD